MKPLFLGSHPAIDFINTSLSPGGTFIEMIGDGRSFVAWLVDAKLLDASTASKLKARFGVAALDTAAAETRKFRAWATDLVSRWRETPRGNYKSELGRLNRLLERTSYYREAVATNDGVQLVEHTRINSADELIALVAAQVGLLIAEEQPELVKQCAGTQCTLWFLDRTKAHRRVFCSATVCGNRAKVAAFRDRQREGAIAS